MAFDKDWNVDKSIPQPDVLATQDAKFVKSFQEYTLSNPHPGYGKDPNIINEYGHTLYPKWVTNKLGERVIVNTPMEEAEVTASFDGDVLILKQDGPTIEQYVAAGYDPNNYPPKGYASKSSEESIQKAKEAHNKGW